MATWTIDKSGKQIDASLEEIREWLDRGEIDKQTQVFIVGNVDWVKLETVTHLLPDRRRDVPNASAVLSSQTMSGTSGGHLSDFLNFRKMLTPMIIKVIFWLSVAGFMWTGLIGIVGSLQARNTTVFFMSLIVGLAWMVAGPIIARIYCEILLVAFSINDSLADIRRVMLEKK